VDRQSDQMLNLQLSTRASKAALGDHTGGPHAAKRDSSMTPRTLFHSACCIPVAVALLSCGGSDNQVSSPAINMAFIPKTDNNLVFQMGNDGAQYAGRDLTRSRGREVKIEYLASAVLDPTLEQDLVRQAIASKKDGLLISCLDDSLTAPINEAVDAGIPVITYDSDCPNSRRLGFYSMQSETTGAKGADLLAAAMGTGPKTVAILTGRAGADNLERRAAGFIDRLSTTHPEITIAATVRCAETAESCGPAVEEEILAQYPDLDGLFVIGLWGLQSACTCSDTGMTCFCEDSQMPKWKAAAKGKLKTVSYDSMPFQLTLINQGYLSALIGQKYFGWGYDTVSLMLDYLTTGREVSPFIDSGFDIVCPNNVADMRAKWNAADFRSPLTPECAL
jgi:ribose transport system substrate-binding protein